MAAAAGEADRELTSDYLVAQLQEPILDEDFESGLSLAEMRRNAPGRIDVAHCVRGLDGPLATGQVGRGGQPVLRSQSNRFVDANLDLSAAPSSKKTPRSHPNVSSELLISAYSQTGRPYVSGGRNPKTGFDGPGLVHWAYAQQSVKIPQSASELVSKGYAIGREDLRPGDILVYKVPSSAEYLVGIYTGNGNFILASSKLDVVAETAAFGSDYGPYFLGGRRYVDDPLAAPLSDDVKTAVANGAVKTALLALGDSGPKPANIYGATKKPPKNTPKRKGPRRSGSKRRTRS
ncbi:MAG: C40 family peptidase [Deltaproteobacteria bacterium]|jgi:hypothetical protein|nr:C40 family peptidase [Deltaproteobacteria bacterium]